MEHGQERIRQLAIQFQRCQKTLAAIGDPTRQQIVLALLSGGCRGVRVGEVTAKSHLSRPAVSHHLGILREAGLISVRREGTKNYYYFDANQSLWAEMLGLFQLANDLITDAANQKMTEEDEV
ncbi:ArsR family transcriptional regulator [Pseudoflavonifractor sp. 60]|uniref:ArsR/SmtB family transcription factor n=1 Tax=Pseudoflavonifractor sp. 60 TaxID=2304576 RepID=UPI00136F43F6|nr:metalloregulator ArsR/SmtB family transcription factor [Pseudoflavonifractor sp. 60]NBI68443.1 ArsR family transcriptional regulator [Pseudoflavonifractor sp. 60]